MSRSTVKAFLLLSITSVFSAPIANAGLILETYPSNTDTPSTIGGYAMTDFAVVNSGQTGTKTSSVASPLSGVLTFNNQGGATLDMTRNLADSTSWWVNGESSDYDIFTTDVSWIKILLPDDTRAFSFNVGANVGSTNNNAWLKASETDGSGINTKEWFNVNRNNTPGFGIYTNNVGGQCSAITSVIIDPDFWGVGNFSINQDSCGVTVSEPMPVALLGLGLVGLMLARRSVNSKSVGPA